MIWISIFSQLLLATNPSFSISEMDSYPYRYLVRVEVYDEIEQIIQEDRYTYEYLNKSYYVKSIDTTYWDDVESLSERVMFSYDSKGKILQKEYFKAPNSKPYHVIGYKYKEYLSESLGVKRDLAYGGEVTNEKNEIQSYFKYTYDDRFDITAKTYFTASNQSLFSESYVYYQPARLSYIRQFVWDESAQVFQTLIKRYHYNDYNGVDHIIVYNPDNQPVEIVQLYYDQSPDPIREVIYKTHTQIKDYYGDADTQIYKFQEKRYFYGSSDMFPKP